MSRLMPCALMLLLPLSLPAAEPAVPMPDVPEGYTAALFAREPMVRHPVSMCFDAKGRLFVGGGPQFRYPMPDTEGDSIKILLDTDGDGRADQVKVFASGFNCIQSLAWKGSDLWVANSPDLTIVRDLDGDDVADEYVLVYTDLGNLEHAVHGLNWGPDGKLYMSKGNSKGLTQPGRIAPQPFRELWGVKAPADAPDLPALKTFKPAEYKRAYHNPEDDWGRTGGVLRCDDLGKNLEIVCRGLRNPWDISFDDGFTFLGTDNDQVGGDKLFAPFTGAHFGWGHGWSFDWLGENHPPTAPASGPLFEGSGTGVVFYSAAHFDKSRRGVFIVADWLRQRVDVYRPEWQGARLMPAGGVLETFVQKGKANFQPTDIEVAPDGTLYILGWGGGYGASFSKNGEHADLGQVYRISATGQPTLTWTTAKRQKKFADWTFAELAEDLGSHIPVWRVNAQVELLRRGPAIKKELLDLLTRELPQAQETWALWTLGRLPAEDRTVDDYFAALARSGSFNRQLQAIRILAHRVREHGKAAELPEAVAAALRSEQARLRCEAVLAIRQARQRGLAGPLLELAARETDRVTFYACWGAMNELLTVAELRPLLKDERGGVRRAALLALAERDQLKREEAAPLRLDSDPVTASVAELWLDKHGMKLPPLVSIEPPGTDFAESIEVTLKAGLEGAALHYTLDGQLPSPASPKYTGPLTLDKGATVSALLVKNGQRVGPLATASFHRLTDEELRRRLIYNLQAVSKSRNQVVERGLAKGARVYTDRAFRFTDVPAELTGATYIMTANGDENAKGERFLTFELTREATLFVAIDARTPARPDWLKIGQPDGFQETELTLASNDHKLKAYRKEFKPGPVVLGGAAARANYIVVARRPALKLLSKKTELAEVAEVLPAGDAQRGASLFFDADGVGCHRCHRIDNRGNAVAPNLADVGQRAKPEDILRSILDPNAVIVEGFRTHVIETNAGKVLTGTVLTETGLELNLLQQDGQVVTVEKKIISERSSLDRSIMPDNFGLYLDKQQVADLVAFLRNPKPAESGSAPKVNEASAVTFEEKPTEVVVSVAGKPFASYVFKDPKVARPFLAHIKAGGGQVSRNHPPTGKDSTDHDTMHPGIWLGFGDVSGVDFWRNKGRIEHDKLTLDPKAGSLTATSKLLNGDTLLATQTCTYRFVPTPAGTLVLIEATFQSDQGELSFGSQEEMGLGIRLATPLTVKAGGQLLDSANRKNEKEIWGKAADWCDYSGVVDGTRQGMAIFVDPKNPAWMHARDYGVLVANPFGPRAGGKARLVVPKGELLQLRFGVLAYATPADKPIDLKAAYQDFLKR